MIIFHTKDGTWTVDETVPFNSSMREQVIEILSQDGTFQGFNFVAIDNKQYLIKWDRINYIDFGKVES